MSDAGGVWRTIGGRRVFIKDGQDLQSAMKESGKFEKKKKKSVVADNSVDQIEDYLYNETDRDSVSEEEIRDFVYNDVLDDELADMDATEEDFKEIFKRLEKDGYKVEKSEKAKIKTDKDPEIRKTNAPIDKENREKAELYKKDEGLKKIINDKDALNKRLQELKDSGEFEEILGKKEEKPKNMKELQEIARKKGLLPSEVQDMYGISDEELGLGDDEYKKKFEQDIQNQKRYVMAEEAKSKTKKSNPSGLNSKEDYEHDLKFFEEMEKKYPSKGGLEANEDYQTLKADYEKNFKTKWGKETKAPEVKDIGYRKMAELVDEWSSEGFEEGKYKSEYGKGVFHNKYASYGLDGESGPEGEYMIRGFDLGSAPEKEALKDLNDKLGKYGYEAKYMYDGTVHQDIKITPKRSQAQKDKETFESISNFYGYNKLSDGQIEDILKDAEKKGLYHSKNDIEAMRRHMKARKTEETRTKINNELNRIDKERTATWKEYNEKVRAVYADPKLSDNEKFEKAKKLETEKNKKSDELTNKYMKKLEEKKKYGIE